MKKILCVILLIYGNSHAMSWPDRLSEKCAQMSWRKRIFIAIGPMCAATGAILSSSIGSCFSPDMVANTYRVTDALACRTAGVSGSLLVYGVAAFIVGCCMKK